MGVVTVFVRHPCAFCDVVLFILESSIAEVEAELRQMDRIGGLTLRVIDVTRDIVKAAQCKSLSGQATVPQVFFNSTHIGNATECDAFRQTGELKRRLFVLATEPNAEGWPPELPAAIVKISSEIAYSSQPPLSQFTSIAGSGIRTVISLVHPDERGATTPDMERAACVSAGLEYVHAPPPAPYHATTGISAQPLEVWSSTASPTIRGHAARATAMRHASRPLVATAGATGTRSRLAPRSISSGLPPLALPPTGSTAPSLVSAQAAELPHAPPTASALAINPLAYEALNMHRLHHKQQQQHLRDVIDSYKLRDMNSPNPMFVKPGGVDKSSSSPTSAASTPSSVTPEATSSSDSMASLHGMHDAAVKKRATSHGSAPHPELPIVPLAALRIQAPPSPIAQQRCTAPASCFVATLERLSCRRFVTPCETVEEDGEAEALVDTAAVNARARAATESADSARTDVSSSPTVNRYSLGREGSLSLVRRESSGAALSTSAPQECDASPASVDHSAGASRSDSVDDDMSHLLATLAQIRDIAAVSETNTAGRLSDEDSRQTRRWAGDQEADTKCPALARSSTADVHAVVTSPITASGDASPRETHEPRRSLSRSVRQDVVDTSSLTLDRQRERFVSADAAVHADAATNTAVDDVPPQLRGAALATLLLSPSLGARVRRSSINSVLSDGSLGSDARGFEDDDLEGRDPGQTIFTVDWARAVLAVIQDSPKPALVHCRSGLAACVIALVYAARQRHATPASVSKWARDLGHDVRPEHHPDLARVITDLMEK